MTIPLRKAIWLKRKRYSLDVGAEGLSRSRKWIIIKREKGIPDRPDAGDRWSVDHLLIDQDAVPTLVEVKRSSILRYEEESSGRCWTTRHMRPKPGRWVK